MLPGIRVAHRLLLIYMLSFAAVAYLAYTLVAEKNIAIDFARKEQRGIAYADVVRQALVSMIEIRIQDEIGLVANSRDQLPCRIHRSHLEDTACGRIACLLRHQLAHVRQQALGKSRRIQVMPVLPLRSSECRDSLLQARVVAVVIAGLQPCRFPNFDHRQEGLADDIRIGDAALLLARKVDGNVLLGDQGVGEIGDRRKAEHVDQQQTVRDA